MTINSMSKKSMKWSLLMPGTQRQAQKEATRKHIIKTAMNLYAVYGFSKIRTSDIAKDANVSHGSVFAHFGTQEELIEAVINEFGSEINKRLHELAESKSSIKEVMQAHLNGLTEFENFYTRLVEEKSLLSKNAQNIFVMIQSAISFHLSQALERGINEGLIKKLPVYMVFNGWVGLIHYYLVNKELFAPGGSVLKRYGKDLLNYYTDLIKDNDK